MLIFKFKFKFKCNIEFETKKVNAALVRVLHGFCPTVSHRCLRVCPPIATSTNQTRKGKGCSHSSSVWFRPQYKPSISSCPPPQATSNNCSLLSYVWSRSLYKPPVSSSLPPPSRHPNQPNYNTTLLLSLEFCFASAPL